MVAKNNKLQLNTAKSSSAIYEGGSLSKISIEDLMNNEVAIRQLINNYNELIRENDDNKREASELKTSLEHIKTTPFVAILSAVGKGARVRPSTAGGSRPAIFFSI